MMNKYQCKQCLKAWDVAPDHFDNDDASIGGVVDVEVCDECKDSPYFNRS